MHVKPCEVDFDGQAYTFKASQQFEKGEELFMSYGSHPNDFLLVEYGFCLEDNESDAVYLDDIVYRELTAAHKKELLSQKLYGNYKVTSVGVCHRAKAVACIKYMTSRQWRNYVLGRIQDEENKTTSILHDWVGTYIKESTVKIQSLKDIQMEQQLGARDGKNDKIDLLLNRWVRIKTLCEDALRAISF
ncbi:uncharacterized protein BHQ10_008664 [Talaromyces amestolkiae]|uniref:SET domain-containing protein n=1 Tax=Talaromyces amestolkiae TaxID=1196081 RepID=A0A364LA11_TALAM|nr:uncharacterized protein BHQ10_008664 [Talaromyces amestolkiae]RAO72652.1 hypothetical protein BHQ10_008664 [Talaromyces amestolkiae]